MFYYVSPVVAMPLVIVAVLVFLLAVLKSYPDALGGPVFSVCFALYVVGIVVCWVLYSAAYHGPVPNDAASIDRFGFLLTRSTVVSGCFDLPLAAWFLGRFVRDELELRAACRSCEDRTALIASRRYPQPR